MLLIDQRTASDSDLGDMLETIAEMPGMEICRWGI